MKPNRKSRATPLTSGGKDVAVPVKLPKRILFRGQKATAKVRHKDDSPKRPLKKSLTPIGFVPTGIVAKEAETENPAYIRDAGVYCDDREN